MTSLNRSLRDSIQLGITIRKILTEQEKPSLAQYRSHVNEIGKRIGIKVWTDWYGVAAEDFISQGGRKLFENVFDRNIEYGLALLLPEHPWRISDFEKISPSTFLQPIDQREILNKILTSKLKLSNIEDWYHISPERFNQLLIDNGFSHLLKAYDDSMVDMLVKVYAEDDLKFWKFSKVPDTYWQSLSNQTKFLEFMYEILELAHWEDWYLVKPGDFKKQGGADLLKIYNGSTYRLLKANFPLFPWREEPFQPHYWQSPANQRILFERIANQLDLHLMEDWYQVKLTRLRGFYGVESLIEREYNGLLPKALQRIFPEYIWEFWKFAYCPHEVWEDKTNQRFFMTSIADQVRVHQPDDWYQVTKDDLRQHQGTRLLKIYEDDLPKLIMTIFEDRQWDRFRFSRSRGFWSSKQNQREFFDTLAKQLGIKTFNDWFQVKLTDVQRYGGAALLSHYYGGSLQRALEAIYPEHKLGSGLIKPLRTSSSKSQIRLLNSLVHIFPQCTDILMEYVMDDLRYEKSGRNLVVDIYIPSLNLAFEYHGEQHYKETLIMENYADRKKKDDEKRIMFADSSTTLIEVPFWWDGTISSLKATIRRHRPDLIADADGSPIPDQPSTLVRHNFDVENSVK